MKVYAALWEKLRNDLELPDDPWFKSMVFAHLLEMGRENIWPQGGQSTFENLPIRRFFTKLNIQLSAGGLYLIIASIPPETDRHELLVYFDHIFRICREANVSFIEAETMAERIFAKGLPKRSNLQQLWQTSLDEEGKSFLELAEYWRQR